MLKKASIPPTVLCKDMPPEFAMMHDYVMNSQGSDEPDYSYLEALLYRAAERNHIKVDWVFDWHSIVREQNMSE